MLLISWITWLALKTCVVLAFLIIIRIGFVLLSDSFERLTFDTVGNICVFLVLFHFFMVNKTIVCNIIFLVFIVFFITVFFGPVMLCGNLMICNKNCWRRKVFYIFLNQLIERFDILKRNLYRLFKSSLYCFSFEKLIGLIIPLQNIHSHLEASIT